MCSVIDCHRTRPVTKDVHLFRYPKDFKRAAKWVEVCGLLPVLKNKLQLGFSMFDSCYKVCSRHFSDSAFCDETRTRLHIDAVPTELLYKPEVPVPQHPLELASQDEKLRPEGFPIQQTTLKSEDCCLSVSDSNDCQLIGTTPVLESVQEDIEIGVPTVTSEICDQVIDLDEKNIPKTDNFDCQTTDTTLLPESLQNKIKIEDTIVTNGIFEGAVKSEAAIGPTIDSTSNAPILSSGAQKYFIIVMKPVDNAEQTQPSQTSKVSETNQPSQSSEPSYELCYKCIDCGEKFERKGKLRLHRIHNHGENRRFKCPRCPFRAFYFCDIKKHDKFAHSRSREKQSSTLSFKYECSSCNFRTNKKRYFLRHSLYHMSKV